MKISIKHSTVHLLHPDSTETAENVGNVFAHDVPLIHARRCKCVGWLIKIENNKERGRQKWREPRLNRERDEKKTVERKKKP
jgi:hypothetical protein